MHFVTDAQIPLLASEAESAEWASVQQSYTAKGLRDCSENTFYIALANKKIATQSPNNC